MLEVFKALFSIHDDRPTLISQATDQFLEMLDLGHKLLELVTPHLLEKNVDAELLAAARTIDKSTNRLEREIRKLLVEHLAFDKQEAPTCLILMSVVKDAERLVDECRNLLDITLLIDTPLPEHYKTIMTEHTILITNTLKSTREAFAKSNESLALEIVENERAFNEALKPIQAELFADTQLTPRQAIIVDRSLRLIERIRAHLANVASTVVFPIHQIDFGKRKYIQAAKDRLQNS